MKSNEAMIFCKNSISLFWCPYAENRIDVYDNSGKLVFNENISLSNSTTNTTINSDILKPGFYIIRLAMGNEQQTIKVIIH